MMKMFPRQPYWPTRIHLEIIECAVLLGKYTSIDRGPVLPVAAIMQLDGHLLQHCIGALLLGRMFQGIQSMPFH